MNDNDNPPFLEEIIPSKPANLAPPKEDPSKNQIPPAETKADPKQGNSSNSNDTKQNKDSSQNQNTSIHLNHSMDKDKVNFRRNSAIYPSVKKKLILKNAKDLNKKDYTTSTQEALEANQTIKDLKWKLELALNDKINEMYKELNLIKEKIELKKEDILNEAKISDKKKKNLQAQIAKEEKQNFKNQQLKNNELKAKKELLIAQIGEIEKKRKDLKSMLQERFTEMMHLRQTLKKKVDEIDQIKKEILNRKFALNDNSIIFDEQSESDSNIRMDSEDNMIPNSVNEFKGELLSSALSDQNYNNISAPINKISSSSLRGNFQKK